MSPLSRERLVIGLAPEGLSALRLGGIVRPQPRERVVVPLQAVGPTQWDLAVDALEILLDTPGWGGHDVTIILSGHYVHYAVLPQGSNLAIQEQQDLARVLFQNTYGALSRDWEIRASPASDQPTLASGVPQALLKSVRAICEGRARLRSIQPALMAIFNRTRNAIGANTGTLAVVESGRTTLATLAEGRWQSIASRASAGNALPQLLDEENELHGGNRGGMLWLADLTGEARVPSDSSWRAKHLTNQRLNKAADEAATLAEWGFE